MLDIFYVNFSPELVVTPTIVCNDIIFLISRLLVVYQIPLHIDKLLSPWGLVGPGTLKVSIGTRLWNKPFSRSIPIDQLLLALKLTPFTLLTVTNFPPASSCVMT